MTNTQSPHLITISLTQTIYICIQILHLSQQSKMIGAVFYKTISLPPITRLSYKYFWGCWFHTVTWEWSKCWYSNLVVNTFENVWLSPHRNILSWRKRIIWELLTLHGLFMCSFPSNVNKAQFAPYSNFRQLLKKKKTCPPIPLSGISSSKSTEGIYVPPNWRNVLKNQMFLLLAPEAPLLEYFPSMGIMSFGLPTGRSRIILLTLYCSPSESDPPVQFIPHPGWTI